MPILIFHIFDREGKNLYEKEWVKNKQSSLPKNEELKLMFGMIHSLNAFVSKMSPTDFKDGFLSFSTNKYKLHYFESSTGLKFILITDVGVPNAQETLQKIYSKVYVQFVVRNPLCSLKEPIKSTLFEAKLEGLMSESSFFQEISQSK